MSSLLLPGEPLPLTKRGRDALFAARAEPLVQQIRDGVASGVADALALSAATAPPSDQFNQPLVDPAGGRSGYQQLIAGATPATNTSFRYRVPGDWILWPLSVICRLSCSNQAGNRYVTLEYQDAADARYEVMGAETVVLTANDVNTYQWSPSAGQPFWQVGDTLISPLHQVYLYPATSLVIVLNGGQAGDQIDQIKINAWIYPTGEPVPPP